MKIALIKNFGNVAATRYRILLSLCNLKIQRLKYANPHHNIAFDDIIGSQQSYMYVATLTTIYFLSIVF